MKQFEIRTLFAKASVGQDVTNIHLSFASEEEADEAFAYLCELGRQAGSSTTTLDDLKMALDAIPDPQATHPSNYLTKDLEARATAWRTAFRWLLQYSSTQGDQYPAFMEGVALIKEKLR